LKEYIFGKKALLEGIKSGYSIIEVLIADNIKEIEQYKKLCKKNNINFNIVKKSRIDKATGTLKNNGIAFKIEHIQYYELDDILKYSKELDQNPFILVLDCLEDPRNFGAIIRSAEASGVHGIIFPENRAVEVSPYVIRTSAGAYFHQKLCRVKNIARTLDELKEKGVWVFGLSEKANKIYHKENLNIPLALVVGSEDKGIRRLVLEKCDFLINIPMLGKVSSLNASVSASIIMYEVLRQRNIG